MKTSTFLAKLHRADVATLQDNELHVLLRSALEPYHHLERAKLTDIRMLCCPLSLTYPMALNNTYTVDIASEIEAHTYIQLQHTYST